MLSSDVTSASLSWQPPSPAHGIITGYAIGYYRSRDSRPATNDARTIVEVGLPLSTLQYNVTGLMPYTTYQLQVLRPY